MSLPDVGWDIAIDVGSVPDTSRGERWIARSVWRVVPTRQAVIMYNVPYLQQHRSELRSTVIHELTHLATADITVWAYSEDAVNVKEAVLYAAEVFARRSAAYRAWDDHCGGAETF